MTETGSPQKTTWWREVLIAFVVGFAVSTYYSAKLTRTEQRAQQAEARVKQLESSRPSLDQIFGQQENQKPVRVTIEQLKQEDDRQEEENRKQGAPEELRCPSGAKLRRVVSYEEFMKDSNAKGTDWECVSKPTTSAKASWRR